MHHGQQLQHIMMQLRIDRSLQLQAGAGPNSDSLQVRPTRSPSLIFMSAIMASHMPCLSATAILGCKDDYYEPRKSESSSRAPTYVDRSNSRPRSTGNVNPGSAASV